MGVGQSGQRLRDYSIKETLDQTKCGRTLLARLSARRVILKEINMSFLTDQSAGCNSGSFSAAASAEAMTNIVREEARQLLQLKHVNLVQVLNAFEEKGCIYLAIEYCSEGSLKRALHERATKLVPEPLTESEAMDWFIQMSRGLRYLHDQGLLHGDLSDERVFFVNNEKIVKLGDSARSGILSRTGRLGPVIHLVGTPAYAAPEVLEQSACFSTKSDVWSLGVLLHQILNLRRPFDDPNIFQLFNKIKSGRREPIRYFQPKSGLVRLTDRMLNVRQTLRPEIVDIVSDLETTITARPFQCVYWWKLKAPVTPAPWFAAPSDVVDLLSTLEDTFVICSGGEIFAVSNKPGYAEVHWAGQVCVPYFVNGGVTTIAHATIDTYRRLLYVTVAPSTDGIYVVELDKVRQRGSVQPRQLTAITELTSAFRQVSVDVTSLALALANPGACRNGAELQRFDKSYSSAQDGDRAFNGLACEPHGRLLLCCDQSRKMTIGVWSTADGRLHSEIDLAPMPLRAFRCALFPLEQSEEPSRIPSRFYLAVSDTPNSIVHLLHLKRSTVTGQLGFVPEYVRAVATPGSMSGCTFRPAGVHFDPDGHLFVADGGNHRIQVFSTTDASLECQMAPAKWDAITTSALGKFAEPTAVVAAIDAETKVPMLLVALGGSDRQVICFASTT